MPSLLNVLLVVKLDGDGDLLASAHAYLRDGGKHRGTVTIITDVRR